MCDYVSALRNNSQLLNIWLDSYASGGKKKAENHIPAFSVDCIMLQEVSNKNQTATTNNCISRDVKKRNHFIF